MVDRLHDIVQVFMNNYIFKIDKYQFLSHCGTTSLWNNFDNHSWMNDTTETEEALLPSPHPSLTPPTPHK